MKKIEIFDTISFTPFGTLACPPHPRPPHHTVSTCWIIFRPHPLALSVLSCRLYCCHLKKIK